MSQEDFASILQAKMTPEVSRSSGPVQGVSSHSSEHFQSSQNCAEYFSTIQSSFNRSLYAARSYLEKNFKKFESFQEDFKSSQAQAAQLSNSPNDSVGTQNECVSAPCLQLAKLNPAALLAAELMRRRGKELSFPLTQQDLKTAFRSLVKQTHPDLSADGAQSAEAFRDVTEAYKILLAEFPKVA